jgi:succinoglycan biosynthesis transport protein ExoP
MDLRQYARVLLAHWVLIAVCVVAATAVAAALAWTRTPVYASHIQLFVSANAGSRGSVSDEYTAVFLAQQRAATYSQLITSFTVRQRVDARIQSGNAKISAAVPGGSSFIDVTVSDRSREQARAVADALASVFPGYASTLEGSGGGTSPVTVTVSRPAELPTSPVAPRKKVYLVLGVMVGLVLGLIAAVVREAFDRRMRDPTDVLVATGKPVVGELAESRGAKRHPLVMLTDPASDRAEEFRRLRANLDFLLHQRSASGIVVTSAAEAEGKTFVAANLAVAFAQMGSRTILVDADLVGSGLTRLMGITPVVALTDALSGEVQVEAALQMWTEGLPLAVLPTAPRASRSSDVITPARAEALLGLLSSRADVVIFDAPALQTSTDALALARFPTLGTLVVARSRALRTRELVEVVDFLDGVDAQVLGVVVNRLRARSVRLPRGERPEARVANEGQAAAERPLQVPVETRRVSG